MFKRLELFVLLGILGAGTAGTWILASLIDRSERDAAQAEFERIAQERAEYIARESAVLLDELSNLDGFFLSSKEVDPDEFAQFTRRNLYRHAAILALAWAPMVSAAEREHYEEQSRALLGIMDYSIRERGPDGELVRASSRDAYLPLLFAESHWSRVDDLRGLDLLTDRVDEGGFEYGIPEGQTHVCIVDRSPLTGEEGPLLLALRAHYPARPQEPDAGQRGVFIGVFHLPRLVEGPMEKLSSGGVQFAVLHPETGEPVYVHAPGSGPGSDPGSQSESRSRASFRGSFRIPLADSECDLAFWSSPEFEANHRSLSAGTVLVAGLLLTLLSAGYVSSLLRQGRLVKREVEEKTREVVSSTMALQQQTDRAKVLARQLLEKNSTLQLALRSVRAGIWSWDTASESVCWDPYLERMFGLARGTFPGTFASWASLVHPEDLPAAQARIEEALATRSDYRITFRARVGGEWRHFDASGAMVPDEAHGPPKVVGVCTDVTELRRAERKRLENEKALEVLVRDAVDGIITIDAEGRVETFNPAAEQIFGYEAEEVVGRNVKILVPVPLSESHDGYIRTYLESGRKKIIGSIREVIGKRKDGSEFPVDLSVSEMRVDERIRFAGIVRDISDRKQAEEALLAANQNLELRIQERTEELVRSNEDLQQFAYAASHDLQEPLRMVSSYVQLLERRYRDRLDEDALQFIQYAVDGSARMKQLIDDLLAYSRIGTQGKPLQPVDVEEVLAQALENLSVAIEECSAEITWDTLPPVLGDHTQLLRLLQNLVGNAIKYRGTRVPAIHVSAVEDGSMWRFAVRDNGIGFDPKHAGRVFEVFQRLHSRQEYSGTGIGLSVCKKIVERHGGRIWAESTPGEGSSFFFLLPRAVESAAA